MIVDNEATFLNPTQVVPGMIDVTDMVIRPPQQMLDGESQEIG